MSSAAIFVWLSEMGLHCLFGCIGFECLQKLYVMKLGNYCNTEITGYYPLMRFIRAVKHDNGTLICFAAQNAEDFLLSLILNFVYKLATKLVGTVMHLNSFVEIKLETSAPSNIGFTCAQPSPWILLVFI